MAISAIRPLEAKLPGGKKTGSKDLARYAEALKARSGIFI